MPNQRVSLLVKARVEGRECKFQLDTGCDTAVVWHTYADAKRGMKDVAVTFDGITHSASASAEVLEAVRQCQPRDVVGTLGNAFFEQGSLVVDLKTPSVTYRAAPLLAGRPEAQPMFYARWGTEGGHPLIEARRDDGRLAYVLLDTGSVPFTLGLLSASEWNAATDSAPLHEDPQVRSFTIQAWGKEHTCFSAPGRPLRVGVLAVPSGAVQYCPTLGFEPPIHLMGVVGMKLFGDATITIDYRSGRWLVEER
jgi:hypothetical protein